MNTDILKYMAMYYSTMDKEKDTNLLDSGDHPNGIKPPSKKKKVPKGCKRWDIGRYQVYSLNRKNAIKKALKLRKSDKE